MLPSHTDVSSCGSSEHWSSHTPSVTKLFTVVFTLPFWAYIVHVQTESALLCTDGQTPVSYQAKALVDNFQHYIRTKLFNQLYYSDADNFNQRSLKGADVFMTRTCWSKLRLKVHRVHQHHQADTFGLVVCGWISSYNQCCILGKKKDCGEYKTGPYYLKVQKSTAIQKQNSKKKIQELCRSYQEKS